MNDSSPSKTPPSPPGRSYVDHLFAAYRNDPSSVSKAWRERFESLDPCTFDGPPSVIVGNEPPPLAAGIELQDRVDQIVRAYRVRGHIIANINPLGVDEPTHDELDLSAYGLTEADLDRQVSSRTIAGPAHQTLRELLERLRNTYCRSIGVQFMHLDDLNIRHWLQERMEGCQNRIRLPRRQQLRILTSLTQAVVLESFLQKKYIGAKTFSLEGCETLIPLLDLAIERAGSHGAREIVIGMAHRGRINVLANIMGKPLIDLFSEFEDKPRPGASPRGDVTYHLGHSADWTTTEGRSIHLSLCFNPSHLEYINTVALGRMRAKQDRIGRDRRAGMVFLIHGDAAMAGEGIMQETLNLSGLDGYTTGGTLHIVVNNQLGFTTPPQQGRSSLYATGVAKMLQIPIFHVNGEDPEAVAQVIQLAMDFRYEFGRDVVVDMYGYRLHGHNETDEPSFTQPRLYERIKKRQSVRDGYLEHLLEHGEISRDEAEHIGEMFEQRLRDKIEETRSAQQTPIEQGYTGIWSGYFGGPAAGNEDAKTAMPWERLSNILSRSLVVPEGFHRHRKLDRFADERRKMAEGAQPVDWATAEALALGSLALEGIRIRLAGQDSERGTFSQRHAVMHDTTSGSTYVPLRHLAPDQAEVEFINSPLSEAGVLGFEYGYSLDYPDGLILWEAQYGDFANAAQVIIDQFIVSAEEKWNRLSGLVMLLPHGYEGRGPEHSSARIERYLLLSVRDNIQVTYPTTAAQYFHLLRRQAIRPWRKPLVIFTPKSLLRMDAVASEASAFETGSFQTIIGDHTVKPKAVKRIILCTGKLYYELAAARAKHEIDDVAIVRIEQLFPLADEALEGILAPYADNTPVVWAQEEPINMGAWPYIAHRFGRPLLGTHPLSVVARPAASSPAVGSHSVHKQQQQTIIDAALSTNGSDDELAARAAYAVETK